MATGVGPIRARGEGLEAIVLAAGAGARFGGGKLRASWRGRPLIEGALATAFASPARSVVLVTGADKEIAAVARAFAASMGESARLTEVHAADHAQGMAASLRAGLGALPGDAEAAFVFLGDMPRIPHGVTSRLAMALAGGALAAAPMHNGVRGHPVLIRRQLFGTLEALTGDQGARRVLDRLGGDLALVLADDAGVLYDVDTQRDLE